MTDSGVVKIHGKDYQTVALRVKQFRENHPLLGLRTRIIESTPDTIVFTAEVWDGEFMLASGHAEEKRGSSQINKTSALENCETSAIGRALAAFGFGGTEFASANEVENVTDFITDEQTEEIKNLLMDTESDVEKFLKFAGADTVDTIPASEYKRVIVALKGKAQREPGSDDS